MYTSSGVAMAMIEDVIRAYLTPLQVPQGRLLYSPTTCLRDTGQCRDSAVQGRGGSQGYDAALALQTRADEEELQKENIKSFAPLEGQIAFSVVKVSVRAMSLTACRRSNAGHLCKLCHGASCFGRKRLKELSCILT